MASVDSNFNFLCGRPHGAWLSLPVHMRPPEPDPPPPCGRHKWMAPCCISCQLRMSSIKRLLTDWFNWGDVSEERCFNGGAYLSPRSIRNQGRRFSSLNNWRRWRRCSGVWMSSAPQGISTSFWRRSTRRRVTSQTLKNWQLWNRCPAEGLVVPFCHRVANKGLGGRLMIIHHSMIKKQLFVGAIAVRNNLHPKL